MLVGERHSINHPYGILLVQNKSRKIPKQWLGQRDSFVQSSVGIHLKFVAARSTSTLALATVLP